MLHFLSLARCFHNLFFCQLAFKGKACAIDHLRRKSPENLSFRDENGASPLHYASAGGHVDIIRLIVSVVGPEGKNYSLTSDVTEVATDIDVEL